MELTKYLFLLIFKIYLNVKKSLPSSFCHINSTQDFKVGPVGLDQAFHKLSNNIKLVQNGLVDFVLFQF